MRYKVHPLMYAVSENFPNTIRFVLEFADEITPDSLTYSAAQVQKRYPYFSVKLIKESEELVLIENDLPFVVSENNKVVCLGSSESNYHLIAFAYDKNVISIDVSHGICDGNGIAPLAKTLAYYYIQDRYGSDGIDTSVVRLVTDDINEDEYAYPFSEEPFPAEGPLTLEPNETVPFLFAPDYFEDGGTYAYHLLIPQKEFLEIAKPNDGSPVSFIGVVFYNAVLNLFPDCEKDIIIEIPHEYRKVLGNPLAHDSLVRVMNVCLSPKAKNYSTETLNTMVRGQIILGCDEAQDIQAINGVIQLNGYLSKLSYEAKQQTMQGILADVIKPSTGGISYTGNIPWGGMDKYIKDVHIYAGEKKRSGGIAIELFTCGDYFSLCMMQPGRNPSIAREMIAEFKKNGISCTLRGEEFFKLPDFMLPD